MTEQRENQPAAGCAPVDRRDGLPAEPGDPLPPPDDPVPVLEILDAAVVARREERVGESALAAADRGRGFEMGVVASVSSSDDDTDRRWRRFLVVDAFRALAAGFRPNFDGVRPRRLAADRGTEAAEGEDFFTDRETERRRVRRTAGAEDSDAGVR